MMLICKKIKWALTLIMCTDLGAVADVARAWALAAAVVAAAPPLARP